MRPHTNLTFVAYVQLLRTYTNLTYHLKNFLTSLLCWAPGRFLFKTSCLSNLFMLLLFMYIILFTGPLKTTEKSNKYVLTFTDYFTKFVEFFPLKSKSADGVARGIKLFICRWGAPKRLLSDQGREFVAQVCLWIPINLNIFTEPNFIICNFIHLCHCGLSPKLKLFLSDYPCVFLSNLLWF